MSKEWLKTLRLIIPGVIISFFGWPLWYKELSWSMFQRTWTDSAIVIVIGVLYYTVRIRNWFFRVPIQRIDSNIKNRLLNMCGEENASVQKHKSTLLRSRDLMDVFYHVIDNDPSLQDRAHDVRLNGLILSSCADLQGISLIFSIIYTVIYWIKHIELYFSSGCISIVVFFFAGLMKSRIEKHHLKLSNEQLDFISRLHKDSTVEKITVIAERL